MLSILDSTIVPAVLMLLFVQSRVLTSEDSQDIGEDGDIRQVQLMEGELGINQEASIGEKGGEKRI